MTNRIAIEYIVLFVLLCVGVIAVLAYLEVRSLHTRLNLVQTHLDDLYRRTHDLQRDLKSLTLEEDADKQL